MNPKSPAIKALGPLFKLTEIFIWDHDSSAHSPHATLPKHIRFKYDDDDDDGDSGGNNISNASLESAEDRILVDNEDVTEEMSALGLPLSFQTRSNNQVNALGEILGGSENSIAMSYLSICQDSWDSYCIVSSCRSSSSEALN